MEFNNKGNVLALFSDGEGDPRIERIVPQVADFESLIQRAKAYLDEQNSARNEE